MYTGRGASAMKLVALIFSALCLTVVKWQTRQSAPYLQRRRWWWTKIRKIHHSYVLFEFWLSHVFIPSKVFGPNISGELVIFLALSSFEMNLHQLEKLFGSGKGQCLIAKVRCHWLCEWSQAKSINHTAQSVKGELSVHLALWCLFALLINVKNEQPEG